MRCQPCYNNACENCDTLTEPPKSDCTCSCVALRARVMELETAVLWALGEGEAFEPPPEQVKRGVPLFWWRTELRRRAALAKKGGE